MFGKKTTAGAPPHKQIPLTSPVPAAHEPQLPIPPAPTASAMPPMAAPVQQQPIAPIPAPAAAIQETTPFISFGDPALETKDYRRAKELAVGAMLERLDLAALDRMPREMQREKINQFADTVIPEVPVPLNGAQVQLLKKHIQDEMLGFGPLETLMADPDVSDIMVNTADKIYIEKRGKLFQTDISFLNEKHLLNIIQKIVSGVGRRIDETSPMVDARMPDGSRFNAIIPPLALDGSLVSIRRFKKNKMPLSQYVEYGSLSPNMAHFLEICGNIRLNIIISGGTGSGKTTLLNALSGCIDAGERVITIEDAAELQLQQPHVLRLETRPPNTEGAGEITQRQLVKNALRMRPDRIILGEMRGDEVLDVLAAMNTGHEGSMATIHANTPRDCLTRIENLVGLSGFSLPIGALRQQISSAIHLIVQIARMRDGKRRITHIEEILNLEGDIITSQTLFGFKVKGVNEQGMIQGEYYCSGIKPRFFNQASYYNREQELAECIRMQG